MDYKFIESFDTIEMELAVGIRNGYNASDYLLLVYKTSQQAVDAILGVDYSRADVHKMYTATKYIFDCYNKFLCEEEIIDDLKVFKLWLGDYFDYCIYFLKRIIKDMERYNQFD